MSRKRQTSRLRSRQVAIMVETEDNWGRNVIQGIADYAQQQGSWTLVIDPRDHEARPALPEEWAGDGIIVRLGNRRQANQIRSSEAPAVNVDTLMLDERGLGHVITDDSERARLALAHLCQRGLTRFAYFAPPNYRFSGARGEAFRAAVAAAGFDCQQYKPGYRAGRKIGYAEHQRLVTRWLDSLHKPIGVFAVDARYGRQLAEICQASNVRVPDDAAILAGDNDELMCSVSSPPLSSVLLAARHTGHEAAALLDRLMRGRRPPRRPIEIKPLGIISRQSTDVLAIDDDAVVRAVRFIQAQATRRIHVNDVLQEVPVSRRMLELQFRRYLGCSPAQHIRQVRLEKAKQLLIQTELPIVEIAVASGFANATRLGVAFRKLFGMNPRAYRSHAEGSKGSRNR